MLSWSSENPDSYRRTRVLVVGPSGAGKSTLCHLIAHGAAPEIPFKGTTVGCNAYVKMLRLDNEGKRLPDLPSTSGNQTPDPQSTCFVELIDVGGHPRYASLRPIFYGNVHGVILVYDVTNSRYRSVVSRWAQEVASRASFTATLPQDLAQLNIEGLPVPVLLVGNKADKSGEEEGPGRRKGYSLSSTLSSALGPTLWSYVKKIVEVEENFRARVAGRTLLPLHVPSGPPSQRSLELGPSPGGMAPQGAAAGSGNGLGTPPHFHSRSQSYAAHHSHSSSLTMNSDVAGGVGRGEGVATTVKGSALRGTVDLGAIEDFLASVVARRFNSASMASSGRDLFPPSATHLGTGAAQFLPPQSVVKRRESPSAAVPTNGGPGGGGGGGGGTGGGLGSPGGRGAGSTGGTWAQRHSPYGEGPHGGAGHGAHGPGGGAGMNAPPKMYLSGRLDDDDVDFV